MNSTQTRSFLEDVFGRWQATKDMKIWLDALDEELVWTVVGSSPTSGTYRSKQAYTAGVVDKLKQWVQEEPVPTLKQLVVEGDRAAAWLQTAAIAKDGKPFVIEYCWMMKLSNNLVTEGIGFYA